MSYEEIFEGQILEDQFYQTETRFVRRWKVNTSKGIDQVYAICNPRECHVRMESQSYVNFRKFPNKERLGTFIKAEVQIPEAQNPCVQRLQELGWKLLTVRVIDEKPSLNPIYIQRTPKYKSVFHMEVSWILTHPTDRILFQLSLYVHDFWGNWTWKLEHGENSGPCGPFNEDYDDLGALSQYFKVGYGDMLAAPDKVLAELLKGDICDYVDEKFARTYWYLDDELKQKLL